MAELTIFQASSSEEGVGEGAAGKAASRKSLPTSWRERCLSAISGGIDCPLCL